MEWQASNHQSRHHQPPNGKDDGMPLWYSRVCFWHTKKANKNGKKSYAIDDDGGRCEGECSSLQLRQRSRMFKWNFINKSCRAKIKCCHKNVILRAHSFIHCLSRSRLKCTNFECFSVVVVVVVRVRSFGRRQRRVIVNASPTHLLTSSPIVCASVLLRLDDVDIFLVRDRKTSL